MFYSQTFLARKGPLGTVWSAAHLQHRLKKSQYTATNIPETVDLIMFPEVPLALRMSGHLLLGIVRIYSKKVDYLFRDCNLLSTWLAKAFVSTQVDLPEDARQAPVESVTLPQALNLDEFDLADDTLNHREFDNHLRSEEDITLTDQIPTGVDPYVAITFDEDIIPESTPMDVDQPTEPVSEHPGETDVEMAYEAGPNNELDTGTYGPRNDTEEIPEFQDPRTESLNPTTNSPETVPEVEKRRDAAPDLSPGFAAQQENIRVESLDEVLSEKEPTIPIIDEQVLDSGRHSAFELPLGSPGFAGSEEERANFVHPSPQLVLQPTPPPPQPQPRQRKRKQFDKVTVLTNRMMRERLDDPSDTLRKRQKMPSSQLNIWRLNNQSKKDQILNEPLFTGFSHVLRSVFEIDCVASKPYLAVSDETVPEPASVSSPIQEAETEVNPTSPIAQTRVPDSTNSDNTVQQTEDVQDFAVPQSARAESVATEALSPQTFNSDDIGIERLRDGGFSEYMQSPPPRSSPSRTDDFTTTQPGTWETRSYGTEPSTSTNQPGTWETRSYGTEASISTNPEDQTGLRSLGLPDIPEMADEELYFLEVGSNTPERSPASQDSNALSGRARALAQYLKQRSTSRSPTSSSSSGDISLSNILAGKTRKLAARMFYETLVLKSRGLIDVQQDQPYSDISLKLRPALFSKVQL